MKFLALVLLLIPTFASAQSVDLLWQGETYTPPFYQGRSLWSTESSVTIFALAHNLGSRNSLNYKWTKNGTILGSLSGVGKNTLSIRDTIISRPQTIKVEIISVNGSVLASAQTNLTPTPSMITVYENNPLYGFMFHQTAGSEYELKDREITFTAFPFFFKTLTRSPSHLNYEWRTDNGGIEKNNSVTYRTPDNATGSSKVSLRVFNTNEISQDAQKSFLVKFGNE